MTNEEIVMNERLLAQKNGLIGLTGKMIEVDGMEIPEPEELHTFKAWKDLGYMVKKGEHAVVTTKLWKMKKKIETYKADSGKEVDVNCHRYYLCKSFLFSPKQVEAIK